MSEFAIEDLCRTLAKGNWEADAAESFPAGVFAALKKSEPNRGEPQGGQCSPDEQGHLLEKYRLARPRPRKLSRRRQCPWSRSANPAAKGFRRMRRLQKFASGHTSGPHPLSDGAPPAEPRRLQADPRRRSSWVAREPRCL